MIAHILKDPWTYLSTGMIIAVQWVMAHVNIMFGIIMGLGGIITLVFRIKADMKKSKIQDIELKIKEEELRRMVEGIENRIRIEEEAKRINR
jgi:hypothetical protein